MFLNAFQLFGYNRIIIKIDILCKNLHAFLRLPRV